MSYTFLSAPSRKIPLRGRKNDIDTMKKPNNFLFRLLSLPASWLYGLAVGLRNWMFDQNLLKSEKYRIPIIAVGNITVGGTGKTPHVEFVLRTLSPMWNTAMISRGYKRLTKGLVVASDDTDASAIGDESMQIHRKFPDVTVVVDANRRHAIEYLLSNPPKNRPVDAFVLDDAYQHRYVEPGINILLIDYNRPLHEDHLLPHGQLREPIANTARANIVIVTKCPKTATPIDYRIITKRLNLPPYQSLFFSQIHYLPLLPAFDSTLPLSHTEDEEALLFTGIETQADMVDHLQSLFARVRTLPFEDHHNFSAEDLQSLADSPESYIITTEKDVSRLYAIKDVPTSLKERLYILPIEIKILDGREEQLKKHLLDYVKKNTTNNRISQTKITFRS